MDPTGCSSRASAPYLASPPPPPSRPPPFSLRLCIGFPRNGNDKQPSVHASRACAWPCPYNLRVLACPNPRTRASPPSASPVVHDDSPVPVWRLPTRNSTHQLTLACQPALLARRHRRACWPPTSRASFRRFALLECPLAVHRADASCPRTASPSLEPRASLRWSWTSSKLHPPQRDRLP